MGISEKKMQIVINNYFKQSCSVNTSIHEAFEKGFKIGVKKGLSAQPEIVRCKNCKHWMPYDWMFSEVWRSKDIDDYSEDEIGCAYCDMNMGANDFCSRVERRANDLQ